MKILGPSAQYRMQAEDITGSHGQKAKVRVRAKVQAREKAKDIAVKAKEKERLPLLADTLIAQLLLVRERGQSGQSENGDQRSSGTRVPDVRTITTM